MKQKNEPYRCEICEWKSPEVKAYYKQTVPIWLCPECRKDDLNLEKKFNPPAAAA